jgi:hypothetical protein
MPTYMQATQKAAAVKATAEQKAAQKQAKADTTAKEPAEEPDVGGEEDSEEEEEGSAPARSGRVPDEESSDDGDETGRCLGCGGSKSIGKVSFC